MTGSAPLTASPEVIIRAATRSDLAAIARLQTASWREAYKHFLPPSYLRERVEQDLDALWAKVRIGPEDLLLVATEAQKEDRLLGFIAVWCRPNPFIDYLHCDPTETGKGVGKSLMKAAFEQLLLRKKQTIALTVIKENTRARNFYLRLGGKSLKCQKAEIFGFPVQVERIEWDNPAIVKNW